MKVIEIRPHRWGWKVFEAPGFDGGLLRRTKRRHNVQGFWLDNLGGVLLEMLFVTI
jgi:hypothetical protein